MVTSRSSSWRNRLFRDRLPEALAPFCCGLLSPGFTRFFKVLSAADLGQNAVLLHLSVESTQQSLETLACIKSYISHIRGSILLQLVGDVN